jgi:ABC-type branched-subunit amino acid transport system substrate-binding protein/ABC-type amino acid transport substrate-binding protein
MFKAAVILSQEYNITIEGQSIGWQSAETRGDVMNALSSTCSLISNSTIVGIVGPKSSRESHFIAPFAAKIGIPVISYGATDSELSDRNIYSAFYRTVPSDNAAALALANLFIRFNWTSCIVIYQNDAFGSGGVKAISEAFNKNKLTIGEMIVFDISTSNISGNLRYLLNRSSIRIVLVWAIPDYITLILQQAIEDDVVGPQFTWILCGSISWNNFNQTSYNKLIGMLIVEPVAGNVVNASMNKTLLEKAYRIWEECEPSSYPGPDNVDYYALLAFDATWTLIRALQEFKHSLSLTNTSICFDRQLQNSNLFFDIINNNRFLGVSGYVQFSTNVTDRINGTYYIVRNVQRSFNVLDIIPVLVWSESNNWTSHMQRNTIVWPGNTLVTPSGYAALTGIKLRIAVIESPPFTMVNKITDKFGQNTTMLTGYVPDLIEHLKTRMGFIPNLILVPQNESYNGLVDDVANDRYDMAVADVTITAGRMKKVAFSISIFDNSLRIIIRATSSVDVDFLSYLRPFSFQLWIALIIATIYAGFLICLLEREHNEALSNQSIFPLIIKSMWYSIGTILGYGADFTVRTAAGRLLTIGLYILSLVSVAAYTAKLASDLTIAKTKGIISGIDDIKNGKLAFSRIGILMETSVEEYYLREISTGNRNFYPLKTQQEVYDKLLDNIIDASIMDSGLVEYFTHNVYCNLTLVGTDFDKNAFGIVFPKNWIYHQLFDVTILSLRESGILDELKRRWFQTNYCSRSSTTFNAMTIESMTGLFVTFGAISVLSLLLFLWIKRFTLKDVLLTQINRKTLPRK